MQQNRGFTPMDSPSGFAHQQMPPVSAPGNAPGFGLPRHPIASHSRAQSSDKNNFDLSSLTSSSAQPIARPAPIQRPSSVKPQERPMRNGDVDDLSNHLGSSALLDDTDDPLPVPQERRQSAFAGPRASGPVGIGSPFAGPARLDSFGTPGSSWTTPSMFGPPGLSSSSSWGGGMGQPTWTHNGFGSLGQRPSVPNRPLSIRLALCQACKQLSVREPTADDFHPVESILRQIENNRPILDSGISLEEIEDICETEGDAHNGGGLLYVRHDGGGGGGGGFSVKFQPDVGTPSTGRPPAALGEIGSPIPGHATPAFGGSGGVGTGTGTVRGGGAGAGAGAGGFGSLDAAVTNSAGGSGFP